MHDASIIVVAGRAHPAQPQSSSYAAEGWSVAPCLMVAVSPAGSEEDGRRVRFAPAGVQIFRRDSASSYGCWGNLAIVLGRHPVEEEHVANYRACIVELHRKYPTGVGLVTVVNDASTPSPSGRAALIGMFRQTWPLLS